ncbi:MAG: DUF2958 domain-containing protein [Planctomycetota bacterium]
MNDLKRPALTIQQLQTLRRIIPAYQMQVMLELTGSDDERDFFVERMIELEQTFQDMPHSGQTDGQGDDAVVRLHYFSSAGDWWITEKDSEHAQHQAFGIADLGCREFGYINIVDLIRSRHVEIDLHWKPITVGEVMAKEVFESR